VKQKGKHDADKALFRQEE